MGVIASQSITTVGLWMQLGATLAILALFAGIAWLTVRFLRPTVVRNDTVQRMAVVSKLALAPKKSLYLVRVDERELFLGVSEGGIVLLGKNEKGGERRDG